MVPFEKYPVTRSPFWTEGFWEFYIVSVPFSRSVMFVNWDPRLVSILFPMAAPTEALDYNLLLIFLVYIELKPPVFVLN